MIGIYKIVNKVNGKCYVGQSKNIEERWKKHIRDSKNKKRPNYNYPLYCAFRKYNIENFEFNVLENLQNNKTITEREQYWYNLLKPEYNQIEPREHTNTGIKVCQIDKKTLKVIKIHNSMKQASLSLGLKYNDISSVINKNKKNKSSGGFYWCKLEKVNSWKPSPINNNNFAKLTKEEVNEIRKLCKFLTKEELSIMYNVTKRSIFNIVNYKTWKHLLEVA